MLGVLGLDAVDYDDAAGGGGDTHLFGGGVFGGVVPLAGALDGGELEDDGAGWGPVAFADFAVAAAD